MISKFIYQYLNAKPAYFSHKKLVQLKILINYGSIFYPFSPTLHVLHKERKRIAVLIVTSQSAQSHRSGAEVLNCNLDTKFSVYKLPF